MKKPEFRFACCRTCRFGYKWYKIGDEPVYWECRKHAPQLQYTHPAGYRKKDQWPLVSEHAWCGEFEILDRYNANNDIDPRDEYPEDFV